MVRGATRQELTRSGVVAPWSRIGSPHTRAPQSRNEPSPAHCDIMPPAIASAKLTLSYPLYASDFDPQNSSFLLVGGGGGEGRTGVDNKIVTSILHSWNAIG